MEIATRAAAAQVQSMEKKLTSCRCACGATEFNVRLAVYEQVGLLTCPAGHHSLLLDSRDYWMDIIQEGRPKEIRCACGGKLFSVELEYEFREDGNVRSVDILPKCSSCARSHRGASFEIKYWPTDALVSRPLDPIDEPWVKAKRRQITAYWQPADAERFARYLTGTLGARLFSEYRYEVQECDIDAVQFHPELKPSLYFTNMPGVVPPAGHDPQNRAPILRLSAPLHMLFSSGIALLHYIAWSEEVFHGDEIVSLPEAFLAFAKQAEAWLRENYVSRRGRNSADNPAEFERIDHPVRTKPS